MGRVGRSQVQNHLCEEGATCVSGQRIAAQGEQGAGPGGDGLLPSAVFTAVTLPCLSSKVTLCLQQKILEAQSLHPHKVEILSILL